MADRPLFVRIFIRDETLAESQMKVTRVTLNRIKMAMTTSIDTFGFGWRLIPKVVVVYQSVNVFGF